MNERSSDFTRLLVEMGDGRKDAHTQLLPLVYGELRRLAASYLRRERQDHTLQPTALVHEAYLRLVDQTEQNWQNRSHFLGIAAHLMRQILVDHARKRCAAKRGGKEKPASIEDMPIAAPQKPEELIALDEALTKLETLDSRQSRIVELRFFAGMTEEEIGHLLGLSVRTVKRDWNLARAWLYAEITR